MFSPNCSTFLCFPAALGEKRAEMSQQVTCPVTAAVSAAFPKVPQAALLPLQFELVPYPTAWAMGCSSPAAVWQSTTKVPNCQSL